MRVYSDILHLMNLSNACVEASNSRAGRLYFRTVDPISRCRVRRNGWNVKLANSGSNRFTNTGTHGAGEIGAASFDDYGRFIAQLFLLDPNARIAHYDGAESFHEATGGKFQVAP
jgi:hypothetical protein